MSLKAVVTIADSTIGVVTGIEDGVLYSFEECECVSCKNKTTKSIHWRNVEKNFKLFEESKVEPKLKKFKNNKDFLNAMRTWRYQE